VEAIGIHWDLKEVRPRLRVVTTRCARHGHPEFVLRGDARSTVEGDLKWLAGFLEARVEGGVVFSPGDTLQVGFVILRVEKDSERAGHLTLAEPDETGWPLHYVPSVARTLFFLREMKDTVGSFGLTAHLEFPNVCQSATICDAIGRVPTRAMYRMPAEDDDSGWNLRCGDEVHDDNAAHLKVVSLYDVACSQSEARRYFAMPPGSVLLIGENSVHGTYEDQSLKVAHGSYLEALFRKNRTT
jgi:hypothetical protein